MENASPVRERIPDSETRRGAPAERPSAAGARSGQRTRRQRGRSPPKREKDQESEPLSADGMVERATVICAIILHWHSHAHDSAGLFAGFDNLSTAARKMGDSDNRNAH